jgi:CHAT domain-containing protein
MNRSDVTSKLLLVAEAQPANSTMNVLTKVQAELAEIRSAVAASPQVIQRVTSLEESTTVNQMAEEMRDSSMVHLACHGTQNSQDALESGFLLGDGQLTVARLMDLKLNRAFFAFLSACETAKGDEAQPDQTVHLAAAMLFAGFKSLVATMW